MLFGRTKPMTIPAAAEALPVAPMRSRPRAPISSTAIR